MRGDTNNAVNLETIIPARENNEHLDNTNPDDKNKDNTLPSRVKQTIWKS